MRTVMIVFGTRPEAIKICPLINELRTRKNIKTVVCVTGQHRQMLDQVLDVFSDKRVQFPAACGVRNIYKEGGTI
jgi:UDP-N-acetylglucosamine 2-epimerase (non-hydrolysing)